MPKVILTRGLPASGKTTFAKELMAKESGKWKRINKDDLRLMLDNGKWSSHNEKFILKVRDMLIQLALEDGFNVIVDDCNLAPKHEVRIKQVIENITWQEGKENIQLEIKDFTDVPLEECIKRDQKRANYVGEKVIRDMWRQFLKPKTEKVKYNPDLLSAVCCDLDGTLCLFGDKNPYERNFLEDEVNHPIFSILSRYSQDGTKVILISGRNNKFRLQTEEWLKEQGIRYDELHMLRNDGDNRKDVIIKQEIYEKHIKDKFNVLFILDDRDQVVEYWRSLGLTCLQVAKGDF